ncbi:MAG: lipid droplet-associated protein [Thermocrispum sp.]
MKPLPLPLRLAAGLAVTARDHARHLPRQLTGLPVTVASQLLQASMRLQQQVTELAIKGDEALSGLQPVEDKPSWATFDEDYSPPGELFTAGEVSVPSPRAEHNGSGALAPAEPRRSRFDEAGLDDDDDPWEVEARRLAAAEASDGDHSDDAEPDTPGWLPNYDVLSLPQLRARLRQFDVAQLGELLAYEKATANRPSFAGMLQRRIERVAGGDASS